MTSQKLPFIEKAGYSAADAAANFVFMTMILFQLNFYTDVFGLTASAAAAVLLWPRLWDAIFDPIMGVLADRTVTRWGKFRPWILWTAVPWSVVMVLAYTTPKGWSLGALMAYALVTNTLLMTLYSMNNMPYSALSGVMTADLTERARLNSYRFIAVNVAQFIVGGCTLPLVAKFSHGHDRQHGWQVTMMIWAMVCLVLFMITFITSNERINPIVGPHKSPKQDFRDLLRNNPWKVMAIMTLIHFAILSFRGGATYNYYHQYADKAAMFDFLEQLGLTAPPVAGEAQTGKLLESLGYVVHGARGDLANSNVADVFNSVVNMLGTLATIFTIMASASFARRFGKKAVAVTGFALSTLNAFAFYLLKPSDVSGMIALTLVGSVVYAPTVPLIWAIFADVADYSELMTGRRFTGMVFATIGFCLKAGLALGSASFLWIMAALFHYDTKFPDASEVIAGYRVTSSIVVGIMFAVCTALLAAYKINKRATLEMAAELSDRRRKPTSFSPKLMIPRFSILVISGVVLAAASATGQTALKEVFKGQFLIGAALKEFQVGEKNPAATTLIKTQFNTITPENEMKWDAIHPRQNEYRFDAADRFVEFGQKYGMFVVGHTLVWHSRAPDWIFKDPQGNPLNREMLLVRMRDHIQTVVGRYKGRVNGWDVVNEAIEENGALRDSPWRKIIGDDYIAKAFEFAHEADPKAELYYNDYGIEGGSKREGALALLKKLKAAMVPITGVGIQNHVNLTWPSPRTLDETIGAFGNLGLKVMITELDVDVLPKRSQSIRADVNRRESADPALDPYPDRLPETVQQALARRYAELFAVYLTHRGIVTRVTLWGVTDGDS